MAIKGKAREKKRARKKLEIDSQKRSKFWFIRRREEQKRCIILSKLQDIQYRLRGEPFDFNMRAWGLGGF